MIYTIMSLSYLPHCKINPKEIAVRDGTLQFRRGHHKHMLTQKTVVKKGLKMSSLKYYFSFKRFLHIC